MLKIENLTKKYKDFVALENINLVITPGQIVGLVGDNGAGKTTLLNCVLGNVKKNDGSILLNGIDIEKNHSDILDIIFMPDLLGMKIDLTIREYVAYLAMLKKENKEKVLEKLNLVLKELDYEKDLKNKIINKMSAGQKKKAFCAALLSLNLKFLILDEPTANLDVKAKEEFIAILKLLHEKGVTILITSHIIEELQQIIDHLIIINNKTIVYDQLFDKNKEKIKDIYDKVVDHKINNLTKLKNIIKS